MENKTCVRPFADHLKIESCKEKIKTNEASFTHLSNVISLAGNDVRLKILYLLEQENELCPYDMSDVLEMTSPALSQHLRRLREGGHIECRREGATIYYSLKPEHLKILRPFFKYIDQMTEDFRKEKIA